MGDPSDSELPDEEVLEPIRKRMVENARELRDLEVDRVLEAEIVAHLLNGRRTSGELAEQIFEVGPESDGFHSYYMRVSRALHSLEKRGYVSTKLFGRDRPYRLTDHCLRKLAKIGGEEPARLLPPQDIGVYASTLLLSAAAILARTGFLDLTRQAFTVLFALAVLLSGVSLTRFIEMVKKVW